MPTPPLQATSRSTHRRPGPWLLILVAVLTSLTTARQLLHRQPFGDFAHLYLGARCLASRCNPYDAAALNALAAARHISTPPVWQQAPVYPPSSLLLALPFTALPWPAAAIAQDILAVILFGGAAILLAAQLRLGLQPATLLLLLLLISNPLQATLEFANPALLAAALAAFSALLLLHTPDRSSSFAWLPLGLAFALKPQLILAILIVLLCVRATRPAAVKAGLLAVALLLAACLAYRLRLGSFDFLAQLRENLRMSMLPGSTSDFSPANSDSFDFLNLQAALSRLPSLSRAAADLLAWAAAALLVAATAYSARRQRILPIRPWSFLALATIIALLSLYHRGYDRVIALLLIPAVVELRAVSRPFAWLFTAAACLWVAHDTLMQHILRRWRYSAQNPLEELALCAILLASFHLPRACGPSPAVVNIAS